MGRLTLLTGGAASGKSSHAVRLATACGPRILFIATCVPRDTEMLAKVARHRDERPPQWTTVEAANRLAGVLTPGFDGAIVDCLTLLLAQLLVEDADDNAILREVRSLCHAAKDTDYPVVVVTNEVGQGLVPEHPLGRRFRDLQGRANRLTADLADEVHLLVCGISLRIKPC
jgi:adenosylcobinamide kinase/adenosylcobinamide-phosphate guanylyltransferase